MTRLMMVMRIQSSSDRWDMKYIIFCMAILCAVSSVASSDAIEQCPLFVEVSQQAKSVPEGWQAYQDSTKYPLVSIGFSEGDPAGKVILEPTGEQGRSISTWSFAPSDEGYWVFCGYNSTSIVLSKKLPTGTISCQVEYDNDFSPPVAKRYKCLQR